jgi:hypothetical protein
MTDQETSEMQYTVVPFTANITIGQGAVDAAQQLEQMINYYAQQGWEYVRLESVSTIINTPANAGCLGLGATPASQVETTVYMVVFHQ